MDTDPVILTVTGWTKSKASGDADGGAASLRTWLEKKASRTIQDYQVVGDAFQMAVADGDRQRFLHVNGYTWAGVNVTIVEGQQANPAVRDNRNQPIPAAPRHQPRPFGNNRNTNDLSSRITGPANGGFNQHRNQQDLFDQTPGAPRHGNSRLNQPTGQPSFGGRNGTFNSVRNDNRSGPGTTDTSLPDALAKVIHKRYLPNEKFLDLSCLATDPDFLASGLTNEQPEKVWTALFITCERRVFETFEKRRDMVETLSLKGNAISSVKEVIAAASTFIKLRNLDLSDNNLQKITDLTLWKKRFPSLEQIILSGNPVDSPATRNEMRSWYRNLKTYNMVPLDAPFPMSANGGGHGPVIQPPIPTSSPVPGAGPNGTLLTSQEHPEFGPGSTFGLPAPGKPDEIVLKEQMGLKFSYETGLKMQFVEEILGVNGFDYDKALNQFMEYANNGQIPADAFVQV